MPPPDADTVTPLCGYNSLIEGALSDVFSAFSQTSATDILVEATRQCEDDTDRRLAPFTGLTETSRAYGIDPDEYAGTSDLPMSIQGTLGMSQAQSLNMTNLVRHHWLNQAPPRYPDMWTYSGVVVTVIRSYGGTQQLSAGQILDGPDNLGHVWFQLGQFIPVGSYVRTTYGGGYTTTPGSLLRAVKYKAASIALNELNPEARADLGHDPDRLDTLALRALGPFGREGSLAQLAMTGRLRA